MCLFDALVHGMYRLAVSTAMSPIRNQVFFGTRKAKISDTEKEALGSGSVGFEQEILGGRPDWGKLLDMPAPQLTEEEQAFINGPTEELCAMLDDWQIRSELKDLPPNVWDFMKRQGFFGMIIPKEYGGLGFSARAHSDIVLKLASRSTTACVTAMVPNSLGPAELLTRYGTPEQKQYYLPRLAKGEEIPSFALTEPDAGSDASGMTSNGVICERNGELGILLNWDKRYITLSPVTTLLGLAFKLQDPEGLLGDRKELGITLALIPANTPGVTIGRRHNPLGVPFHNGPTQGQDVWVPIDHIIGGREYAGQGWRMLMECLSVGRSVSLPALSTGSAKLVSRITGAYSRVRKQFRLPIGKFEGIEELLARIAGNTYMMEAARVATLQMLDRGEHPTIISAILKYHMTETGRKIVNDGMDILGGKAICEGPGNLLGPLYHGTPIGITVEGANILTRNMIIFGQGSVRSHPYLLKEIEAARLENANEAKRQFTDLMARHVRHTVENTLASLVLGLSDGAFSSTPHCSAFEKRYFKHINRLSAAYATVADATLMVLGDSVKRKERISALLGDTMSYLYLASCTLRHFMIEGRRESDRPLVEWVCQTLLHQTEDSLDKLLQNFPNALMAFGLRTVVFPAGRRISPPSHKLERHVAKSIFNAGDLRDRLTHGIYLPGEEDEALAELERAFESVIIAEGLEVKIQKAKKEGLLKAEGPIKLLDEAVEKNIITRDELSHLRKTEALRKKVLSVDDFPLSLEDDHHESQLHGEQKKKPSVADGKTLKSIYPLGTRWNLDIPNTDLVSLFDDNVRQYTSRPCVDFLGKKYTFTELSIQIQKAAAGLQALGVKPGDKIGLYMPNTAYYPIMFYAALKTGATVVNFCPMNTPLELAEQAKDSQTKILVTLDLKDLFGKAHQLLRDGQIERIIACRMEDILPFFKAHAFRILRADQTVRPELFNTHGNIITFKELTAGNKPFTPVAVHPSDLAVLQYTGGTTGTPKGAMLTHANLVANIYQIEEYFKASADKPDSSALLSYGKERVLSSIPYFHIFGMTVSMLTNMKMGGELLILPDPRDTREALKIIQEKKPTLFPAVPRLLQAMAENPQAKQFDLSPLRTVIAGGAALSFNVKEQFEISTRKSGLIKQGYGLTETSPVVSSNPPYGLNKPESVGLPIPRTKIKITDPDNPNRILPMGEAGEICISGPQVMRGYYNKEKETADVLYDGWLRTGDIGYLDEDYYLHIIDRKKRLILVNGLNAYPTQIEQAIAKHPAVAECIVISVPDSRSGEAAKAFIRLKADVTDRPTASQMREFLTEYLSRIELPKHIEFVNEELPKTAVGKPDWRKLQEQERVKYLEYNNVDESLKQHPPMEQAS